MTATVPAEHVPVPPVLTTEASRPSAVAARVLLAASVALLLAGGLVLRLGLVGGDAIGAADNGDAGRLYCVAHLVPDTTDRTAPGHGVAITEYRTGGPGCSRDTAITSAGLVLQATVAVATALDPTPAAPDGSTRFSLEWLGAAYVALLVVGAGAAAFTATQGRRLGRSVPALLLVIGVPAAPLLVVPWWSRFLVSSFSEAAGLVGIVWTAWGLLALALTRPTARGTRVIGLGLVAIGGIVAVTAKPGFLPVGLAAVVACLLVTVGTTPWRRRVPGVLAAVLVVGISAAPVLGGLRAQNASYAWVNAHNLAFTAVLPEAGPSATGPLGLHPDAWGQSGQHFYLDGGRSVRDWQATVGDRSDELRTDALRFVARHPVVLARMVHRGLVATLRPQIPYLASATGGARTVDGTVADAPPVPEGSQTMGPMFVYLDGLPGRWVPPTVVALALLAGASTLVPAARRRLPPTAVGLARVSSLLAVTGVGVVVVAVLGDGYCELAKHVWLGSYALVLTGGVLTAAVVATAGQSSGRNTPRW
ncbi:hypothetical protein [Actinomycetospora termitidis]|uniref:Uncharacterized protein n=1 Tax=Actinomycetospora termitidis TaxID=3053470 RepID=A0ABT7MJ49_9PSEU|nr:hypothetical protein [Actinomycetospora sp. Odt1-22]MDL5160017.1 hypothetical protein [Actinomycetospora sp. Odt1-22]